MKKDLKAKLLSAKVRKPNRFLMSLCLGVLGILNRRYKVKFQYDYDPSSIKDQPTILLSSHASRLEFIYTLYGFKRRDINMVCGYQNILQKGLFSLFLKLGVISKYLYQPDFICVKKILKVLRRGGAVGLFPEGIQSTSGSTHPINPATAQFIKRSRANIVVCTTRGAYLATNRYSSDRKRGHIGVEYRLLFTPDALDALSEEEIYQKMLAALRYDDFAYNREAHNAYIGKRPNADGITRILYRCPDCRRVHTLLVDGDAVVCRACGYRVRVNEYYELIGDAGRPVPASIDEWYKWQRRCVAREIQSPDFSLEASGTLCTLRTDKLVRPPKNRLPLSVGKACLTPSGLSFQGEKDGQPADFLFEAKGLYSMTYSTKGFLEFYYNNEYYMLVPEDGAHCLVEWTLASEEIHNLYDEKWREACADVYEYEKGEHYEQIG